MRREFRDILVSAVGVCSVIKLRLIGGITSLRKPNFLQELNLSLVNRPLSNLFDRNTGIKWDTKQMMYVCLF